MTSESSDEVYRPSIETMLPIIRMPEGARETVTPCCRTASGSWDSTRDSLFCTFTCASSAFTLLSNVSEMEDEPVLDVDSM